MHTRAPNMTSRIVQISIYSTVALGVQYFVKETSIVLFVYAAACSWGTVETHTHY